MKDNKNNGSRDELDSWTLEYAVVFVISFVATITVRYLLGPFRFLLDSLVRLLIRSPLVSVSAIRSSDGRDVIVAIAVSETVMVEITDLQSQQFISLNCRNTCQGILRNVGNEAGTVIARVEGHTLKAGYPPAG